MGQEAGQGSLKNQTGHQTDTVWVWGGVWMDTVGVCSDRHRMDTGRTPDGHCVGVGVCPDGHRIDTVWVWGCDRTDTGLTLDGYCVGVGVCPDRHQTDTVWESQLLWFVRNWSQISIKKSQLKGE